MNDEEIAAVVMQRRVATLASSLCTSQENWRFCNHRDGIPVRSDAQPRIDVQSEAFKAWFGDSVLVDTEGRPKIFWHGSFRDFAVFDQAAEPRFRLRAPGFYFTSKFRYASRYGYNLYKVALRACHVRTTTNYDDVARLTNADISWLVRGGYDAIAYDFTEYGDHRGFEVVVFSQDQIALISRKHIGGLEPPPD